jgi:hypothetical protein
MLDFKMSYMIFYPKYPTLIDTKEMRIQIYNGQIKFLNEDGIVLKFMSEYYLIYSRKVDI